INPKIFVRSEDRDFNYEPIFDCLQKITLCNSAYCCFHLLRKHHKASAIKKSNLVEIALS
ncbi:hypothetical protein, partial [Phocaeicola vulgatus]|uniref:hypothetical protein n=1 Tax=Phocaeicola vulgatus TaxID=821 RepID=UPI001F38CE12